MSIFTTTDCIYMSSFDFIRPSTFDWNSAPLRSYYIPLYVSFAYVFVIVIHRLILGPKPVGFGDLQWISASHNAFLAAWSLVMFLGCTYEVYNRTVLENSWRWLLCEHSENKSFGPLFYWSYIYYISKFYELFDTILQLFRGKLPPNYFLHVYHHALVLHMCWFWLEYSATMQFVALLFNTAVHVVMYYYFFLRSLGLPPPWKSFVTTFQIIQFITSLACFVVTLYFVYGMGMTCKSMNILFGQLVFNVSLLYGFIGILFQSKRGKRAMKSE